VASEDGSTVTEAPDHQGFRFVRTIRYAGADFGKVDLLLRRNALDAAVAGTRYLLIALSVFVMVVVVLIGWLCANLITKPIGRLRRALEDAATGNLAFRISHHRSDEFGAAFDAFNHAAAALEPQLGVAPEPEPSLTETLVAPRRAA
jgi:serine/threonine-protein kinase